MDTYRLNENLTKEKIPCQTRKIRENPMTTSVLWLVSVMGDAIGPLMLGMSWMERNRMVSCINKTNVETTCLSQN